MFVRCTKGQRKNENIKFFRSAVINNTMLMMYDDKVCAIGKMNVETEKSYSWNIRYSSLEGFTDDYIIRRVKYLIGCSYLWNNLPKKKKQYNISKNNEIQNLKPTIKFLEPWTEDK